MSEEYKKNSCRFCKETITTSYVSEIQAFKKVCNSQECAKICDLMCPKTHSCGHHCNGFRDEKKCLECLEKSCVGKPTEDQNSDSLCPLCQCDSLGYGPCVRLSCNHIVHSECMYNFAKNKWGEPTQSINFKYL